MENKINIVELLKDCPQGMELDCTMFEDVHFDHISDCGRFIYCYVNYEDHKTSISFNKYGAYCNIDKSKCVIFPKGKKTWEGFHRPFVEGDIVSTESGMYIGIVKSTEDNHECCTFCSVHGKKDFHVGKELYFSRFATKEEKQIMFDIIKANGYRWNPETKTLETLLKFKVGDRVSNKNTNMIGTISSIINEEHEYQVNLENGGITYILFDFQDSWELVPNYTFKVGDKIRHKESGIHCTLREYAEGISAYRTNIGLALTSKDLEQWELAPNKFDVRTLKPFESKVLVRHNKTSIWMPAIFGGYIDKLEHFYYMVGGTWWKYCIPYQGNEYLRGTTDDCNNYYKTWE